MNRKRWTLVAATGAMLAMTMVGLAVAQTGNAARPNGTIHVVLPSTGGHVQFFDFAGDGLTLGDRLDVVTPMVNEDQTERVGTAYFDCWLGAATLQTGNPYDCTYVLRFHDGNITMQGLDPHGTSDVLFAITGGTGAYAGATGQAQHVDSETQTDIYIDLG
jgi:allene oxide cyclase-like protein